MGLLAAFYPGGLISGKLTHLQVLHTPISAFSGHSCNICDM